MKVTVLKALVVVFSALTCCVLNGCRDNHSSSNQAPQKLSVKEEQAIKDLSLKTGMSFPADIVIVSSDNGGGRDPSYGFYQWSVFSPNPIKMPAMQAPGVKDYLNMPLENAVKLVEGRVGKKLMSPQSAFGSEWETNNYTFRGTCVRAADGDYLVIQQFRKK